MFSFFFSFWFFLVERFLVVFAFFWIWFILSILSFFFLFFSSLVFNFLCPLCYYLWQKFFALIVFCSYVICIRNSIVFNIICIIICWYLFRNFIYNCLSSFYFIYFVYSYFSIKTWKFFQKFFITYYICRFIF